MVCMQFTDNQFDTSSYIGEKLSHTVGLEIPLKTLESSIANDDC